MAQSGQVGAGKYQPTSTTGSSQLNNVLQQFDKELKNLGIGATVNIGGTGGNVTPNLSLGLLESLSNEQLSSLAKMLKKMGYTVKSNRGSIKNLFETEPELIQIVSNVTSKNGTGSMLISELANAYIPIGSTGEGTLPSRTVTLQDPAVLGAIVDKVYMEQGMRKATAEERQRLIDSVKKDIEQGTLTTVKKVKNPKTGKMENVTTIESGFSQSKFETNIAENFKTLNPDDFDRAKRIAFNNFLYDNTISGGQ